jgi:hypothetical protein
MIDLASPIADDEVLYRRVVPDWITYEDGRPQPMALAFKDRHEKKLSVVVGSEASLRQILRGRPEDSVISVPVKAVRNEGLRVERDHDPALDGHAVIIPAPTGAKASRLAHLATWVKFRDPRSKCFRLRRRLRRMAKR